MTKFISYNERHVVKSQQRDALSHFQIICITVATIASTIIAANIFSAIPMSVTTENAAVNAPTNAPIKALFLSNS